MKQYKDDILKALKENFKPVKNKVQYNKICKSWDNYCRSNDTDLFDIYESCSQDKKDIMQECKEIMQKCNGYDGRIPSYNRFYFTFAFKVAINGILYYCLITATENIYIMTECL